MTRGWHVNCRALYQGVAWEEHESVIEAEALCTLKEVEGVPDTDR